MLRGAGIHAGNRGAVAGWLAVSIILPHPKGLALAAPWNFIGLPSPNGIAKQILYEESVV